MENRGITFGYGFLSQESSFDVQFSLIEYDGSHSYFRAYLVGLLNTILVSVIGIVFATIIGVVVGIARLSSNYLIERTAAIYVEFFRNIPLLLQIFFWYFAALRALPLPEKAEPMFGVFFLTIKGFFIPAFVWNNLGHEVFNVIILGSDQGRELYKKKLIRLVEQYRLTNQVKFIDHCKNMPLAYKVSDIIVSSSIEPEAFGRISVEAQAMKKPIVASNIGGSKETINENKTGFLFEASNSDDLSKKLIEIMNLDEQTINQMGIEGRKNVVSKFNVEKMCFSTYSEYKKLIN